MYADCFVGFVGTLLGIYGLVEGGPLVVRQTPSASASSFSAGIDYYSGPRAAILLAQIDNGLRAGVLWCMGGQWVVVLAQGFLAFAVCQVVPLLLRVLSLIVSFSWSFSHFLFF